VSHEQLIRDTWESISRGDYGALEAVLAPNARWRAVEDGPWNCENRSMIVQMMRQNREAGILDGSVETFEEFGDRAIVAFRPTRDRGADTWPLENGIRYVVVSTANDLVIELKGCANRQLALDYIEAGAPPEQAGARTAPGQPAPQ
jgi:ketosteroid isomerase-like protein